VKALITTVPFGKIDTKPLELLNAAGIEVNINPIGRKLTELELADLIPGHQILIAGTEKITDLVLDKASELKLISRVGIGLDSVDLWAARERNIEVSYTPDAPSPAVAELTIALMLSLLRHVQLSNIGIKSGVWHRYFGKRICDSVVGIVGVGRIGKLVVSHLLNFGCKKILINDINGAVLKTFRSASVEWCEKNEIYKYADVISLHVPLTATTLNMIAEKELENMKPGACLVNTSRGGIVNEKDLESVLRTGHLSGVALDVFEQEPYDGPLAQIDRCILTAHMGSMSQDCRTAMEIEAVEEAVRLADGTPLVSLVPEEEYLIQSQREQRLSS